MPESAAASPARNRSAAVEFVGLAIVVTLLAAAFQPAVLSLIDSWSSNETYSYGFLVPAVSAALIWSRRDLLRATPVNPSLGWGTAVTAAGLLMLLAGHASTLSVLEQLAMVVTFCGLTLLLLGRAMFRALAFPIGYLIAMIPVWDLLTARVHPYFQDYSASLGVATLRALDLPVHRDGFFLYLPNVTLEVARECSGVNNLIAVLCVGIPMTHLSVGQWWKRGLILAAAVLIALLSNGARVAMVSLFAYYGIRGADGDIHGPFSLLRSLMVSGVGFLVLFWLISRFGDTEAPPGRTIRQTHREERFSLPVLNPIPLVVAAIMLASANALGAWREVAPVPIAAELDGFPQQLGSWRATGVAATSGMEALNFDRSLSRVYSSPDGDEAHVFIGYYGHQTQGRELADYRMRNALVGPVTVAQTLRIGDDFRVKDFVTVKGGQAQHVTYWYVLDGRIVPEDYQVKLYTAWNSLSRGRSNGAVVVVRARADEPIAGARGRVRQLVADAVSASRADGPASGAGRRVSN